VINGGRVLVVDDFEAHRYVMGSWLRREGFEVLEAATGSEALSKVGPDIDVVVLDVHLPDMTGFDVCAAIKRDPATSMVPVMHVSATAIDAQSRAQGLDGGAEAYLIEPLDVEEFLAVVRSLSRTGISRRRSDRSVDQLTMLGEATVRVNAAGSLLELLEAITSGAAQVFGASVIAGAAFGDGRVARSVCPADAATPTSESSAQPPTDPWPRSLTVTEQLPATWDPILFRSGAGAARWCLLPVPGEHGPVGAIGIALPTGQAKLTEFDLGLFRQLVLTVRVAMENLRAFTAEHRIALTLQRALLPNALPVVAGLEFEARYFAAEEGISVGGDFYDCFELDTGQVCAVIGDVQGHSLYAATIMAELRFSLRAFLGESHSPVRVLDLLDKLMRRNHPKETATMVLLLFDADRRRVEIANAGHLPPLLVTATEARFIFDSSNPLLGILAKNFRSHLLELTEPCALVLVTDGLIERRGEGLDISLAALRDTALQAHTLDPVDLADLLVDRFASGSAGDDIALLVTRSTPFD
jgi:CheY-like chemotaxis protein